MLTLKQFLSGMLLLCLCVGPLAAAGCKPAPKPLTTEDLDRLARQFCGHLIAARPAEAVGMMGATMAAALPAAAVTELWSNLVTQLGAFEAIAGSRFAEEAGYRMIYLTLHFKNAAIDMKVVFDTTGKVTGLWFGQPAPRTGADWSPPAYADLTRFMEYDMVVGQGSWLLPGTLALPVGASGGSPVPAVVLVHGSGPNDRDETIGPNKAFRDLAWGLASQGIAVLRYEKRTRQYQQLGDLSGFTVDDETIEDAMAAVTLLRATPGIAPDKVFVLGHSLGAMLAPRIGRQLASAGGVPRGLVMLAGNARPMEVLVIEQSEYLVGLDGQVTAAEAAALAEIKEQVAAAEAGTLKPGELAVGAPQAYWNDLRAYDQLAAAKVVGVPMLLLQGERDYQVTMTDFELWREALTGVAGVTMKSYPALNHLFIAGEGQPNPSEYMVPGHVGAAVVSDITAWIKGLTL